MAFCPVCKCEYKEGIKVCADCKVPLVDSLENEPEVLFEENKPENMVKDAEELENIVPEDVLENKNLHMLDRDDEVYVSIAPKKVGVYRNNKELSYENKTTAYMLLAIGILGILALVLIFTDVIRIYYTLTAKIIVGSLMGAVFIFFIIMGIISLKNAKKYGDKAKEEGNLNTKILDYCTDNLSSYTIEKECEDEEWAELSEEMKYFKRIDYIKNFISEHFMNLDEEHLSYLADEMYSVYYEDEEV